MKVLDAGHDYELTALDGGKPQRLTFVKREGSGYPGNVGHHGGVIMQEVLRALIDRSRYVNQQIPDEDTADAIRLMQLALYRFEQRAARRHGRTLKASPVGIEYQAQCVRCGHIECKGH